MLFGVWTPRMVTSQLRASVSSAVQWVQGPVHSCGGVGIEKGHCWGCCPPAPTPPAAQAQGAEGWGCFNLLFPAPPGTARPLRATAESVHWDPLRLGLYVQQRPPPPSGAQLDPICPGVGRIYGRKQPPHARLGAWCMLG